MGMRCVHNMKSVCKTNGIFMTVKDENCVDALREDKFVFLKQATKINNTKNH